MINKIHVRFLYLSLISSKEKVQAAKVMIEFQNKNIFLQQKTI
jgi:hypothetical protein